MQAYIKAISYHFPDGQLTNELINEAFPEWSVQKIAEKIGVSVRRITAENEFASDLAIAAAQKLFAENDISPAGIDYVLLCTQSPDYFLPTTACIVHEALGLPHSAGAVDINQGCSGFIYGLSLAKGLIYSEDVKNILLITAETYSKYIHPEDKSNRTIFGDAASAVLISSEGPGYGLGRFALGTDGGGANNLIVKRGMRFPNTSDTTYKTDEEGNAINENYLHMNGSEIFNFTISAVPALLKETLEKNNLAPEDIDLFIFHQANKFMLDYLKKKNKIPDNKFYIFMEHCGNTVSSTIPIALKNAAAENRISKGDKIMLVGFGVGYSWGGCVIEYS